MDNQYRTRNRIYGAAVIAVLAILVYLVATKQSDSDWFDYSKRIGVLPLEGEINNSRSWIATLNRFAEDDRIAGILIPINSPGGQVAPSQELYHAIREVREKGEKPVFVSMSSVAASGGYYAALGADSIFANEGTLTGSIGVVMQFPIYSELMEKVGVGMRTVKSQDFKDAGSPFREMSVAEQEYFQTIIRDVYEQFTEVVSQERGIDELNLHSLANGRIFTGRQAQKENLVDALGTFQDARRALCVAAGIPEDSQLQYPEQPRKSWWSIIKDDVTSAIPGWESSSGIKLQYRIPY